LGACSSSRVRTSADGDREVPDRHARRRVGDAGEERVAVQDVAGDAAVADLVARVELRAVQDALGRDTWVPARAAPQLWGGGNSSDTPGRAKQISVSVTAVPCPSSRHLCSHQNQNQMRNGFISLVFANKECAFVQLVPNIEQ